MSKSCSFHSTKRPVGQLKLRAKQKLTKVTQKHRTSNLTHDKLVIKLAGDRSRQSNYHSLVTDTSHLQVLTTKQKQRSDTLGERFDREANSLDNLA